MPSKNKAIYRIENMDCPTEEALIRKKLASVSGIESLDFNLMQRMLTVGHNLNSLDAIESALGSIGMQAVLQIGETSTKDSSLEPMPKTNWWPLAIAGITATLAEIMELLQLGNQWIVIALVIASIASGGLTTYKKGWIALKNGNLNINALMSIAVTGAMAIGSWPEAAMVMFLFTLAEVIEAKSLDRARNAIRGLLDLTPETATVQQADGSWVLTDVKAIALGALVRVRPGERIALDGILISGNSAVNQAPITGESLPVDKIVGDEVFAGTINQTGSFEYKVARKGILIKGGAFLEAGRSMKVLALDKTGTLTYGKPAQTDFFVLSGNDKHIHEIAISLAARSDHPVSLAIAHTNQEQKNDLMTVDSFEAILGRGVKGVIEGNLYYLGNHRLIEELGLCSDDIENRLLPLEQQGKTAVLLTNQTEVLAIIAVADTVRETSKQAIDELHQLGVTTIMLTGDNQHTAKAIGKQVGVDEIMGNLLPEDKLKIIDSRLKKDPNVKVGMVGDGINDAPALARASIGFAMGAAGTDTAIETADVALMDDDLRKIATFIRLSKSTALILTQNIVLALGIKAIFLVLTFTGQATMWMAVFADMGASLLVVANGLRLLRS